jgi:TPR repeat protein
LSRAWREETEAAAAKGRTGAQIALASSKISGRDPYGGDVPRDIETARDLLERARKSGAITATYLLASTFEVTGEPPEANAAAIALYEEAARGGSFYACIALGRIYSGHCASSEESDRAREWYKCALETGHDVDDAEALNEARIYIATGMRTPGPP